MKAEKATLKYIKNNVYFIDKFCMANCHSDDAKKELTEDSLRDGKTIVQTAMEIQKNKLIYKSISRVFTDSEISKIASILIKTE